MKLGQHGLGGDEEGRVEAKAGVLGWEECSQRARLWAGRRRAGGGAWTGGYAGSKPLFLDSWEQPLEMNQI